MAVKSNSNGILCFKRWSRRKYSILCSLSKTVKIGVLCLAYTLVSKMPVIIAQTDTVAASIKEFEEVQISGTRSQVVSNAATRIVSVIQRDEIEKAGIRNFNDLLEFVSNVDIRQRGPFGIQSDVSIRGSSFDHVMILINGVNLSDPQTGHLSMDLPVDIEIIQRIEILEGSSARTLGPGAFSGAINIVTSTDTYHRIRAGQMAGQHRLLRTHMDATFKTGPAMHLISGSRASSNGYAPFTGFENYNLFYQSRLGMHQTVIDIQAGYQDKDFGAGSFYSPRFPEQYEETGTTFISVGASTHDAVNVSSKVYWRRKKDHFWLFTGNDRFDNYHLTNIYGSQLNMTAKAGPVKATVGFDIRSEGIISNSMGFEQPNPIRIKGTDSAFYNRQYSRTDFAAFLEFITALGKWHFAAGLMINRNSGYQSTSLYPGIDISYRVSDNVALYGNLNRSLHLPTFTDMFYKDPVNQGNLELLPNRMISAEVGIKCESEQSQLKAALFYNRGRDIVDWLWSFKINKFSPVNLKDYKTTGISANYTLHLSQHAFLGRIINPVKINWTYLYVQKSAMDSLSKYYHLKQKLSVMVIQPIMDHISLTWLISYQDRFGEAMNYNKETGYYPVSYKPIWLIDFSARWDIHFLQVFTEVSNLLDTRYYDAGSAAQPGRWFRAGLVYTFSFKTSKNQ